MPKFKVEHQTKLSKQEAYEKIKNFLQKEDLTKMAPGAKLKFTDSANQAHVEGPQFKANIDILDQGPGDSRVTVNVDLGFLLTPLKGKVEEILKKQLAKHLG
jgi:hypothetical protein